MVVGGSPTLGVLKIMGFLQPVGAAFWHLLKWFSFGLREHLETSDAAISRFASRFVECSGPSLQRRSQHFEPDIQGSTGLNYFQFNVIGPPKPWWVLQCEFSRSVPCGVEPASTYPCLKCSKHLVLQAGTLLRAQVQPGRSWKKTAAQALTRWHPGGWPTQQWCNLVWSMSCSQSLLLATPKWQQFRVFNCKIAAVAIVAMISFPLFCRWCGPWTILMIVGSTCR